MKKAFRKIFPFPQAVPPGRKRARKTRGQSLVEIAIAFPFIIMLLGGLVEFGFMLNYYLSLLDATREAARTFNNFDPFEDGMRDGFCTCDPATACQVGDAVCIANCVADRDDADCDRNSFYQGAAGMVLDSLQPRGATPEQRALDSSRKIILDPTTDDVVVSVFSVGSAGGGFVWRFPENGEEWHWYNNQPSRISTAEIQNRLVSGAPDTGIILVEVFYNYHQVLALPWLAPFLPDPIMLHAYTIMPLPAAEPQ